MAQLNAKQLQEPNALPKTPWKLIFLAFVFLFTPNINVIDLLPDFVGYFIIVRLLRYPADLSPYFAEARSTFQKLAWLSVLKIPAIAIVLGSGVGRGDTTALLALGFGVGDLILGIMAVKYLFDALFYLGERTNADAILHPFSMSKKRALTPESYRGFTILFIIVKCAVATLPEFLLLTENTADGIYTSANLALYPMTLILAQLLGLTVGIVWLRRSICYAKALFANNTLEDGLYEMFGGDFDFHYETKFRLRSLAASFVISICAVFLAFTIRFDNLSGAFLLPSALFPLALSYALFVGRKYYKNLKPIFVLGLCGGALGIIESVLSAFFFEKYGIDDLYYDKAAKIAYLPYEIVSLLTCSLSIALLVLLMCRMRTFVYENTGISPSDNAYRTVDRDFHKLLLRRAYLCFGLGISLFSIKGADVILYGIPKILFTNTSDITMPTIVSPALPWLSTVAMLVSVAFILSALYFFSTLKDEVMLKYENA